MTAPIETGAWSDLGDDEGTRIAYGTREDAARALDVEPGALKRQPWADACAPNDPPARAWIENGFTYQCAECEHALDDSGCEHEDCRVEGSDEYGDCPKMVFIGDEAFCSQAHADDWKRDREERAQIKRDARAMFEALVPTAEIHSAFVGALGLCEDEHGLKAGIVRFKAPTMKQYGDWCSVCRTAHVVAPDVEALKSARAKTDTKARRWHWRTWNLLLQIQEATDGQDRRQIAGEMTERNLCVVHDAQCCALERRGWIECVGTFEIVPEDSDVVRHVPAWVITDAGRKALALARAEGIQVQ